MPGHDEDECYDGEEIESKKVFHNSATQEEGAMRKFSALEGILKANGPGPSGDKRMVEISSFDMLELAAMASGTSSGEGKSNRPAAASGNGQEGEDEGDDSGDDGGDASVFIRRPAQKVGAAARSGGSAGTARGSGGGTAAGTRRAPAAAAPAPSPSRAQGVAAAGARAHSDAPRRTADVASDGRTARLLTSIDADLTALHERMPLTKFEEANDSVHLLGGSAAFQKSLRELSSELTKFAAECRLQVTRCDRAKDTGPLVDARARAQLMVERMVLAGTICKTFSVPNPSHTEVVALKPKVAELGLELSLSIGTLFWRSEANVNVLHDRWQDFKKTMQPDSAPKPVVQAGIQRDVTAAIFNDFLTCSLRKIKPGEVTSPKKMEHVVSLLRGLLDTVKGRVDFGAFCKVGACFLQLFSRSDVLLLSEVEHLCLLIIINY